jgi:hypothetical protein
MTTDLTELLDGPENRGSNLIIPRRPGSLFRAKVRDSKTVNIPIVIFGDRDPENNIHANPRQGLIDNINALKKALYLPSYNFARVLTYYRASGNVEATCQTSPKLDITPIGPTSARAVLTIEIPSGVLRSTTNTVINQWVDDDTTFSIGVPGAGEVLGITYNIPGAANSLTVTNNTTSHAISFNAPITNGLVVNTFQYTAFDGATNVSGGIQTANTPFWIPLLPGTNELRVQRPGGASVAMSITFKAVWL